ncbi:hypothetical protein ES702_05015 [subsurface metagenome]
MEKTCFIEGIDSKLYKDFKAACAYYELSIKEVLVKHMQNIVEDYLKDRSVYDVPKSYKKKGGKKQ